MEKFYRYLPWILLVIVVGLCVYLAVSSRRVVIAYDDAKAKNEILLSNLNTERLFRRVEQSHFTESLGSLQKVYDSTKVTLSVTKTEYNRLLSKYNDIKTISRSDSVSVVDCDSVVDAASTHIATLSHALNVCDSMSSTKTLLIRSLVLDTLSYSRSLESMHRFSVYQQSVIDAERKKNASWWNKNKGWVGFVSGVVVTSTGVYLISK